MTPTSGSPFVAGGRKRSHLERKIGEILGQPPPASPRRPSYWRRCPPRASSTCSDWQGSQGAGDATDPDQRDVRSDPVHNKVRDLVRRWILQQVPSRLLYSLPGRTSDVDARSGSGSRLGWTTDTSSHYPCRGRWESWTDRRHRRNCKWRFPRDDHEGTGGFLENPRAHQVRGWGPPTEDHKALEFDRW